ncbi:MlaD family protein [Nocardia vaccinii]|uniref:MlaD family protein n=1 Tax=Nocardia vaccinii TaxID=1822 RepID=UPI000829B453|nr:MlaD family protein [Nocardia vaccinii]
MWRSRIVSTVAVVVAATVAAGVVLYRQYEGAETRSLCAYFDNTFGLYADTAVTIRGIPVGKVRALTPDGGRVRVAMSIDDRRLPANVGAAVVNSSILTDRRVELVDTAYRGGPEFTGGQCITQDRTRVPISASDALNSFAALVHRLTTPDSTGTPPLQALLTGADRETSGLGPTINDELRDLGGLMSEPDTFMNDFGRLIDDSAELSAFVTGEWSDIKTTLSTFGPGLELIEHLLELTKVVVGKLGDAIGPLNRLFTQHFPYLMEALNSTVPVVTLIRNRTDQSKDLLDRIPGVILMLRNMIDGHSGAISLSYRPPAVTCARTGGCPGLPQALFSAIGAHP